MSENPAEEPNYFAKVGKGISIGAAVDQKTVRHYSRLTFALTRGCSPIAPRPSGAAGYAT